MCALLLKFTQRAEGNRWAHTRAKVEAGGVLNDSDDYYDLPRSPLWSGGQLPFWLHGELRGPSFARLWASMRKDYSPPTRSPKQHTQESRHNNTKKKEQHNVGPSDSAMGRKKSPASEQRRHPVNISSHTAFHCYVHRTPLKEIYRQTAAATDGPERCCVVSLPPFRAAAG